MSTCNRSSRGRGPWACLSRRRSAGQLRHGSIFDFHEDIGYGQQGRDYVVDNHFQVVFGGGGELPPRVTLDGSGESGIADIGLHLSWGLPMKREDRP